MSAAQPISPSSPPPQTSRQVFDAMWARFHEDKLVSRAQAYANLQKAMTQNAALLVPDYFSAEKFQEMVTKLEDWIKSDSTSQSGSPLDLMAEWLAGKKELSRIPLEQPPDPPERFPDAAYNKPPAHSRPPNKPDASAPTPKRRGWPKGKPRKPKQPIVDPVPEAQP